MYNRRNEDIFRLLISSLDKSMQAQLKIMFARNTIIEREEHRREMEQLKREVAEYVISHITATVDISEVLMQIEELRKAIDSLGR